MNAMRRSLLFRGLVVLASATGVIVGCSETATEGNLPKPTGVATPEDSAKLQKKLLAEKVAPGTKYQAPPGVNIPRQ
jgi:hypothetical protein